jgi:NAD(P)H-dependent FMN reductase
VPAPKILIIPGSLRKGSHNLRLAVLVRQELTSAQAEVTSISLADYPLPIYDADLATEQGMPANALRLKQLVCAHHGVFIVSPEYNASVPPLLKNAIDWVSTVREAGEAPLAAYQNRIFALGGASPGRSGAMQSLLTLRQILAVGCRALVLAEQVTVPNAREAFAETGALKDERAAQQLRLVARKLVATAQLFG